MFCDFFRGKNPKIIWHMIRTIIGSGLSGGTRKARGRQRRDKDAFLRIKTNQKATSRPPSTSLSICVLKSYKIVKFLF